MADLDGELEKLTTELRRQGRAAIAAQAAAEECLAMLQAGGALRAGSSADDRWLRVMLPVLDALDRTVQQAEAAVARARWPWQQRGELTPLADGLRVLQAQTTAALDELGVAVERPRIGARFDPQRHRAVGSRRGAKETIVEIVRPGYWLGAQCIREADVIVGEGT